MEVSPVIGKCTVYYSDITNSVTKNGTSTSSTVTIYECDATEYNIAADYIKDFYGFCSINCDSITINSYVTVNKDSPIEISIFS